MNTFTENQDNYIVKSKSAEEQQELAIKLRATLSEWFANPEGRMSDEESHEARASAIAHWEKHKDDVDPTEREKHAMFKNQKPI